MSNPVLIAPSLLACNFAKLGEDVERVTKAGADLLHMDFMDGHFVPNLSFGFPITQAVTQTFPDLKLDVHLMVTNPDEYLEKLAELGAYQVSVHWETCPNLHRTLQRIRGLGMKAGVAYNPHTPIQGVEYLLEHLDNILIMTVNPGFGGQSFLTEMLPKIRQARSTAESLGASLTVSVDGGINGKTGPACVSAGADLLVAGSYLFDSSTLAEAIQGLRQPAKD